MARGVGVAHGGPLVRGGEWKPRAALTDTQPENDPLTLDQPPRVRVTSTVRPQLTPLSVWVRVAGSKVETTSMAHDPERPSLVA